MRTSYPPIPARSSLTETPYLFAHLMNVSAPFAASGNDASILSLVKICKRLMPVIRISQICSQAYHFLR